MSIDLRPSDIDSYRRDGFVHIRGAVERPLLERIRQAIETTPERFAEPNPLSMDTMRFASNLLYSSEVLQDFLASPQVVAAVTKLRGPSLWVRWDQAVWKGPGAPMFPWHQDNGYTELDVEHLQLWLALTDSNETNGGLAVVRGGHREALVHHWVGNHVETDPPGEPPGVAEYLEAAPGDVILFSSWLPHATTVNSTNTTRLAYVAEYLPISEPDRSVPGPHFVAALNGEPDPHLEDLASRWNRHR